MDKTITAPPFHDRNSGDHIVGARADERDAFFTGFMYKLVIKSGVTLKDDITTEFALNVVSGTA